MGPAAWAAVGRALGLALVTSSFGRKNNVVRLIARELHRAILNNELNVAEAMLRDLAFRHRESFKEFIKKYKDQLPEEMLKEFADFL